MITDALDDTTIKLSSGRALAFTTWGEPAGGVIHWPDAGHLGVVKRWAAVLAAIHPERCSPRPR
jgi:hypothetical protein